MRKRIKWALIGLVWALAYGFLSALITGGGHGNFVWLITFFFGYLFGTFIPIMGFIGADPRPFWAKTTGISIVVFWFVFTAIALVQSSDGFRDDIVNSWERSPLFFIFMSGIHLMPISIFTGSLISGFLQDREAEVAK